MKSTLYVASSLNGFMTKGESDSDWVSDKDEAIFSRHCQTTGCLLVGRKTFEQYRGIVYPVPKTHHIVLSSQKQTSANDSIHHATSLEEAVSIIQSLGFDRFVTVGGSTVIGQVIQAGLIDEIYLSLHPYLFAKGLPTFGLLTQDHRLEFDSIVEQHAELILLRYKMSG